MKVEQLMEWELAGETEILRENLPLLPQIPYDLTWNHTRAAMVGSQQLTI
jgi:hypothetical protein